MKSAIFRFAVIVLAGMLWVTPSLSAPLIKYPDAPDTSCRNGRAKIYDECSDQMVLFKTALSRANSEGKTLLISFGAEWCIWCHVFEAYIEGEKSRFDYTYASPDAPDDTYNATLYEREKSDVSAQANDLKEFVATRFVLVNIDSRFAPNGNDVLENTGAIDHYPGGLPFIFTVDHTGAYSAQLFHERVETRRDSDDWYRGYNREKLQAELGRMDAATAN